jgi:hypothetical protein
VPPPTPLKFAILMGEIGVVDRIVGVSPASIRADMEIVELTRLPIAVGAGVFGGLHPVPLLQTKDVHLGLSEAPGHGGAGSPGADDQDVDWGGHVKPVPVCTRVSNQWGPRGIVNGNLAPTAQGSLLDAKRPYPPNA